MKKSLFMCCTVVSMLFAHLCIAQVQWGVRAGLNASNSTFGISENSTVDTDPVVRLQIGFTVDIPISNSIYLLPSIMYQGKGFKGMGVWPVISGEESELKVNLSYLVMPLQVVFKPKIGENGRLLAGAGPYLGYGMGGAWQAESDLLYDDIMLAQREGEVNFTTDGSVGEMGVYNYGKPWDYGIGFLLGYEYKQVYSLQVNADFGLANLQYQYGDYDTGQKLKNSGVGLSLGYKF